MAEFSELIKNLAAANETALVQIENNRNFNKILTQDLTAINQQIRIIIEKIKGLKNRLQELQGLVETNQINITRIEGEKTAISQELTEAVRERDTITRQLQGNEEARNELIAQIKAIDAEKQKELRNLQNILDEIRIKSESDRNTTQTEKAKFNQEMRDTMIQIQQVQKAIQDEKNRLEQELANLNITHRQLEEVLNASKQEVANAKTQYQNLENDCNTIRAENTQLKENLNAAREIIIKATQLLNSLSQEEDYVKIRQQIDIINEEIREINGLLDINEPEFQEAREAAVPLNTTITQNYMSNGRQNQKTFTLGALLEVLGNINMRNKDALINRLTNARSLDEINKILETLNEGQLANILQQTQESRGGKKTRRGKKTCKGGKKTKRKQRKQKGGYHYSERSKRRSLTTTSSSRRSKRRTKRTTRG
jgi:chromosome segregation ATPase